jgi:hypothetical protein
VKHRQQRLSHLVDSAIRQADELSKMELWD